VFLDSNGLIVQASGDGGDTAQRMGMWWAGYKIRHLLELDGYVPIPRPCGLDEAVKLLVTPKGLIRNPSPGTSAPFWNDPTYTSRDQTNPMIMACGLWRGNLIGMGDTVKAIRPGFTYLNGDPAGPEDWNLFYRSLGCPGMPLGDSVAMAGVIVRCHQGAINQDDVGDDLNTLLSLTFSYIMEPQPLTRAPLEFYLIKRPPNFGNTKLGEKDPVIGALVWYFRPDTGGNPECAEMWRDIVTKLRSDLNCPL
jgi:hypothetical protein